MTKSAGISARVTEATKDRLDDYAATSGIPKSEIIEAAINNYLDVIQDVTQNVTQDVTQDEQAASELSNAKDASDLPQNMMPASEFSNYADQSNLPVNHGSQQEQATVIADLIARIEKLEANTINQQQLDERLAIVMGLNLATNENAINQHQLDERLAMATAPLWDAIHDVTQDVIQSTDDVIHDVTQDVIQSTDDVIQPTDNATQDVIQDVTQSTDNATQDVIQDETQDVIQSTDTLSTKVLAERLQMTLKDIRSCARHCTPVLGLNLATNENEKWEVIKNDRGKPSKPYQFQRVWA